MEKREIIKEYSNGELTIIWQPAKCIHAEICAHTLPQVYNPNERPWIKANEASTTELKAQIDMCPSGALSYRIVGEENKATEPGQINVQVLENGPLLVSGAINVIHKDGHEEVKTTKTAFCRCGASNNKPYCDGAHAKINFKG